MIFDGSSAQCIRSYLHRWARWWVNTSETWQYQELLQRFIDVCWEERVTAYAVGLHQLHFNKLHSRALALVGAAA